MSHSMSRRYLTSTVIASATHHSSDINIPSRKSVGNISDVIHVGTREQSSEWYSGRKPEDLYGDDWRLLTLPDGCATRNVAHGDLRARYRVRSLDSDVRWSDIEANVAMDCLGPVHRYRTDRTVRNGCSGPLVSNKQQQYARWVGPRATTCCHVTI